MSHTDQRIDQIGSSIREQVQQQSREIIERADARRKQELDDYQSQLVDSMFQMVQKEVAQLRQKALGNIAGAERAAYRALLSRRQELTALLFVRAADRLKEYSGSPAYKEWLLSAASAHRDTCGHTGSVLHLRGADMAFADEIAAKLPGCQVREDAEIRLGGFKLYNESARICIDETLEARLEEQKPWFLSHCGLRVMPEPQTSPAAQTGKDDRP